MPFRLTVLALAFSLTAAAQTGVPPAAPPQAAAASAPQPDSSELSFTGEVLRGQPYDHDIGHDLVFHLTPATSDDGGGWVIEILPVRQAPDDPVEFSEIATPPYHAYNERYVAAAFG